MAASLPATVLDQILAHAKAALTTAGLDVPDRAHTAHGQPDVPMTSGPDDDVLAVWLDRIEVRALGERRPSAAGESQEPGLHVVLPVRVDLWRCYPGTDDEGGAPDADDLTEHAEAALRGAWAVLVALIGRRNARTLLTIGGASVEPRDVGVGTMAPLPVSGYTAGWRITLEVSVPATLEA